MKKDHKLLTKALRELANEAETTTPDGDVLTKAQVLAQKIWERAIGSKTVIPGSNGDIMEIKAQPWAMQFIFERLDGRVPNTTEDNTHAPEIGDRVEEIAKTSLNNMAEKSVSRDKEGDQADTNGKLP